MVQGEKDNILNLIRLKQFCKKQVPKLVLQIQKQMYLYTATL